MRFQVREVSCQFKAITERRFLNALPKRRCIPPPLFLLSSIKPSSTESLTTSHQICPTETGLLFNDFLPLPFSS